MSMSTQEIFTTVAVHLLRQNARSMTFNNRCLYRGPNGLKCAVGKLITDSVYSGGLEGVRVDNTLLVEALRRSGVDLAQDIKMLPLLDMLQHMHDRDSPEDWPVVLQQIAKSFDLQMPNTDALLAQCSAVALPPETCAPTLASTEKEIA